jgi:hypothetical protein
VYKVVFKPDMKGRHNEPAVSANHFVDMNVWCEENCNGMWNDTHIWLTYEFELEEDAMLFKLIWG